MTSTPPTPAAENTRHQDARERAIAAATAVFDRALNLYSPHRHLVVEALDAAADVMTKYELAEIDRQVQEAGFAGMDVLGADVTIRLQHSHDFARAMVTNFDELIRQRGADNYVETEFTVTDPALEEAIAADVPVEEWPARRRYTFIVVRPEGKTPHQLRQEAEARAVELEQRLATVQQDTRRELCQEIYDLAGNLTALRHLVDDAGGDPDGPMSVSRARSLLRSLAALGGVLDPDGAADLEEWPEALLNARVRIWFCPRRREHGDAEGPTVDWSDDGVAHCLADGCGITSADTVLAGRYFDEEQKPGLVCDGVPDDEVAKMRGRYIGDVCADPERLRKLRELYAPADAEHQEEGEGVGRQS